ncbi:MAG: AMP-dependent synthetase and ligase [Solirubrobacterales bacterium]|nr:AMP-dependent synthetase and ligase [Solirubrobacterales bacterium]
MTVLHAFRAQVARRPDAVLLRHVDAPITVAEVDARSDALAAALAARGVERGDRVALHLQNDPEYVYGLLASWKLGAIAVACSPMLAPKELRAQLVDAEARVLITLDALDADADGTPVEHVMLSSSLAALPAGRVEVTAPAARDVAVLSYTSGTTGPPKGAMNTHGNIVHGAGVYRDFAELDAADVVLGIAPLFHVTGLVAHAGVALLVGSELILAHRFDAARTLRLIEAHGATFTVAASTAYTALINAPAAGGRDLSTFTKAYTGGAPVSPAGAAAWQELTGSPLHTVYGLTETTSPSHMTPLGRRPPVDPGSGALSVGVAVTATESRIVDPDGATVEMGETGEIAIRGPQVVPGYWRRPEETAAALPGGELRTGDVGLVDADGWFYVVDRIKDLINASGFKVWPRDVEDALYEHPAVREVAVVGVPDDYRGETVKAYVSLKAGADAGEAELIAFARERLAPYKAPRAVQLLDELPKTATGKILRRELRAR